MYTINKDDQSVANYEVNAVVARIYVHIYKKRPPSNNSKTIKMWQNIIQNEIQNRRQE